MKTKNTYFFKSFILCFAFSCIISCKEQHNSNFSETVKVSLREVGHQLLIANQDSTSLVKPVIALAENKFALSFESRLAIQPDSLVNQIKKSFKKVNLPQQYITEVTRCDDQEVAYSYMVIQESEKGIIPCSGRELKKGCYFVTVHFTQIGTAKTGNVYFLYILGIIFLLVLAWFGFKKKRKQYIPESTSADFTTIGRFQFYPEQNKLIKEAVEIRLSKKECEILALFVAQPNQIIKREEITKKVWEDHGVVVGRSLDTYISKLRKKLQEDTSIQLTNVHGVGYKLELL